jgi:hypothetical protein
MPSPINGYKFPQTMLLAFVLLVFAVCMIAFIRAAIECLAGTNPIPATVTVFGVGIAIICGMIWVAHVTGTINLRKGVSKGIWTTLILTILVSTGANYKAQLSNGPEKRITLGPIRLVNVERHKEKMSAVTKRLEPIYRGQEEDIAFVTSISQYAVDKAGKAKVVITVSLENRTSGIAEFGRVSNHCKPDEWRKKLTPAMVATLQAIGQMDAEAIGLLDVLAARKDIGAGTLHLKISVVDILTGYEASGEIPITINGGLT